MRLQSRFGAADPWSDTGQTAVTTGTGAYSITVGSTRNTSYRVVFDGDTGHASATSSSVSVSVATRVSLTVGKTTIRRGGSTLFAGVVAPNHAGDIVRIQKLVKGVWTNVGQATLDEDSLYSYDLTVGKKAQRGTSSYRVIKPGDGDHTLGTSRTVAITVA